MERKAPCGASWRSMERKRPFLGQKIVERKQPKLASFWIKHIIVYSGGLQSLQQIFFITSLLIIISVVWAFVSTVFL